MCSLILTLLNNIVMALKEVSDDLELITVEFDKRAAVLGDRIKRLEEMVAKPEKQAESVSVIRYARLDNDTVLHWVKYGNVPIAEAAIRHAETCTESKCKVYVYDSHLPDTGKHYGPFLMEKVNGTWKCLNPRLGAD